jgi:hypothetical protein
MAHIIQVLHTFYCLTFATGSPKEKLSEWYVAKDRDAEVRLIVSAALPLRHKLD